MNRSVWATLLTGFIVLMGSVANAQTDLIGRWNGFGHSSIIGPEAPALRTSLDIVSQDHRRFSGDVNLPAVQDNGGPLVIPVGGTIAGNNTWNIVGHSGGMNFEAHGKIRVVKLPIGEVREAALKYRVIGPNRQDQGFLIYLQMQGGPSWDQPGPILDVSGYWMGDYKSAAGGVPGGGCIEMLLNQQRSGGGGIGQGGNLTTAFDGILHMDGVYLPAVQKSFDLVFDMQGTVGLPAVQDNGRALSPFAALAIVSPGPPGGQPDIIAILIGLLIDPNNPNGRRVIRGDYALYGSFSDVFNEIWTRNPGSFDTGRFSTVIPGPPN